MALALASATALAQESQIGTAAGRIAESIQHTKKKKTVVLDFIGPSNQLSLLGTELADDFSAALSKSHPSLPVEDRSQIRSLMQKKGFTTEALIDSRSALSVAQALKMDVAVLGTLSRDRDHLRLAISATLLKGYKVIDSEQAVIPLNAQAEKLMRTYFESGTGDVPESGKNGYSLPRCLICPPAQTTSEAINAGFLHETVILVAVITATGQAEEISVVKTAPYGLADSAVEAVRRWKFAPAEGPDGKPAPVRQIIDVIFRSY
jgi:TonB family protein